MGENRFIGLFLRLFATAPDCCKAVVMLVATALLPALPLSAAENPCENILAVEDACDKNQDGIVDASDWELMSKDEKIDYARRSVRAAGGQPDADAGHGKTHAELYLTILQQLYRP